MIEKVYLKMPECNMEIISDDSKFLKFIRESYYLFLCKKPAKIDLQSKIFLHRDKNLHKKNTFISPVASMDEESLICKDGPLTVEIKKNPLRFESWIKESKIKRIAKLIIRGKKRTMSDYYEFLSQRVVRYPLFYYWEQKGFQLHHSATIEKNGYAYLFIGFNKIGKSTAALKLSTKGYKIMSDNFSLIKNKKVYPYMRGMRVTDFVKKRIKDLRLKKLPIEGNKYQVILDKQNFNYSPAKIKKLFFFKRAGKFRLKKITKDEALEQLMNISNILDEYYHHHFLSFIPFFTKDKISINRIKNYKELSKIEAYNVEYSNIEDIERIEKLLK